MYHCRRDAAAVCCVVGGFLVEQQQKQATAAMARKPRRRCKARWCSARPKAEAAAPTRPAKLATAEAAKAGRRRNTVFVREKERACASEVTPPCESDKDTAK